MSIEIIGEGYEWTEGPVWIADENMLLFSDVPQNIIYLGEGNPEMRGANMSITFQYTLPAKSNKYKL